MLGRHYKRHESRGASCDELALAILVQHPLNKTDREIRVFRRSRGYGIDLPGRRQPPLQRRVRNTKCENDAGIDVLLHEGLRRAELARTQTPNGNHPEQNEYFK
jgi:hypothetical protein